MALFGFGKKKETPAPAPVAPKPAPAPKVEPPKSASAPAKPAPVQAPVKPTPAAQAEPQPGEEDYRKGMELRRAKDFDGAIATWTRAAEQGHREALKKLIGLLAGDLTIWGFRNKESREKYVDYDKAIEWGITAMERGVDTATSIMDAYKGKGQMEAAIAFGEKAIGQGFDVEWKLMYFCMELGRYEDAVIWGQKYDEKKGKNEAKEQLAQIRDEALKKALATYKEEDYPQALSLFEKSASFGSSSAMFNCGQMYEKGIGTKVDDAQAIAWYQKAAQQGNTDAKSRLEYLLTPIKAEQGDAEAQYQYAQRLESSDKKAALEFCMKSVEQGYADAQYCLGLWYAFGRNTIKDSKEALRLFQLAAGQGHKEATELLTLMKKTWNRYVDLEVEILRIMDRYDSLSLEERNIPIEFWKFLSADLQVKFLDLQAAQMKKLADSL